MSKALTITTTTRDVKPKKQQRQQPKRKAPRQQPRQNVKRPQRPRAQTSMQLMRTLRPCTLQYLKTLVDPWASYTASAEVCIPDLYDLPSQKFAARARGTFGVGSQGLGYVLLAPFALGSGAQIGCCTASTYVASGTILNTSGTGVVGINDGSYPWGIQTGSYNPPQVRLVAAGLRIRYTGTELNRAGNLLSVCLPSNADLQGMSTAALLGIQSLKTRPNNRQWVGCCFNPALPSDYAYYSSSSTFTTGTANPLMAVIVMGDPTVGNSYEYDIVRFFEAVPMGYASGQTSGTFSATFSTTKSESDLEGLSIVKDFMGSISGSDSGNPLWNQAVAYLRKQSIQLTPKAIEYATNYAASRVGL